MENPKKNREARRKRFAYPALEVGEAVLVEREECGRNVPIKTPDGYRRVLHGQFVFRRAYGHRPAGDYVPHVGAKQKRKRAVS